MKLLIQSDDFGITEGVTLGIIKGIEDGLIRNTGLFTNMQSSAFAASYIKKYPNCCFGIDINLVSGYPISDASNIPSLVDENGKFITSGERLKDKKVEFSSNLVTKFEVDPYTYEDVIIEMEAQILKYIELVGCKPEYIHPHSLVTSNIYKAFKELSSKYQIPFTVDIWQDNDLSMIESDWNTKPIFELDNQKNTSVDELTLEKLKKSSNPDSFIICHAGYVDADLLELSSYSLIRARDLEMVLSKDIATYIEDNQIQLVTYRDYSK